MVPDGLDAAGWSDIVASGVTTVIDLRNDYEVTVEVVRPDSIAVIRSPIEDQADASFMSEWGERLGSPIYYAEILRRWPALVAAAFIAIADAPDVALFHCAAGRDRTGMISAMIEELVGVERTAILDDYAGAVRAFNAWKRAHPNREPPQSDEAVEAHLVTAQAELTEFLDSIDVGQYLLDAGLTPAQLARIRSRLLDA